MPIVRAINRRNGFVLGNSVTVAESFLERSRGLLGRSALHNGEGMVVTHTSWVHSIFMRFAFDAIYVARDGRVCGLVPHFRPNRLGRPFRDAKYVLEMPEGTIESSSTKIGDVIQLVAS